MMRLYSTLLLLLFYSNSILSQQICEYHPSICQLQCEHGYIRDLAGQCTCNCAPSPCQKIVCTQGQHCTAKGSKAICSDIPEANRKECPRISGGVCALRCETDLDCSGRLICCSNGCGRECVVPVQMMHIPAARPIQPVNANHDVLSRFLTAVSELPRQMNFLPVKVQSKHTEQQVIAEVNSRQKDKIGECRALTIKTKECKEVVSKCHEDGDCNGYQKCCMTHCGPRCMDPVKATVCVHLALAVGRLPNRELANGYAPNCTVQGKFTPVQCDRSECWCVDVNYGSEIAGTRVLTGMRKADMCINIRPCSRTCPGHCPHGLLMDQHGCPVDGCLCRDICHGTHCVNPSDSCQLVEPDCNAAPCLPVPRCLINPCPTGLPMTLPTGITALCAHNEQCSNGHWCHMIGYNGLGFCCHGSEPSLSAGQCPPATPSKGGSCAPSSCNTDEDCSQGKCCYDGCGLSCLAVSTPLITTTTTATTTTTTTELPETTKPVPKVFQLGKIALKNKDNLSSLVADCPNFVSSSNCSAECTSDDDCTGMKRCCRAGCGTQCVYFQRSTYCFHMSLTSELYSTRFIMKCDAAGFFDRIQCDDHGCFCVDINSGQEIAGSRKPEGDPDCFALRQCEDHGCRTNCPFGYVLDPEGCPTCKCINPCQEVKCPQGSVCVMTAVDCFTEENCPLQPRCVLNMCPVGDAAISPVGVTESCSKNSECPKNHWCHDYGLSSGGLCCPLPNSLTNAGSCPAVRPSLTTDSECRLECRSDEDCASERKCCFDGCGTLCTIIDTTPSSPSVESSNDEDKTGVCPYFDTRKCGLEESSANECGNDSQCPGVMKCCSDGCRRMCIYPERLTRCLQLKAALQQIGQMDRIKCRPDGVFEKVQCDSLYCWCVDKKGHEIEGTRTSDEIEPDCKNPRRCIVPLCATELNCKFGLHKDSNGCNTCQCHNPCQEVICPDSLICVPVQADCSDINCQEVPRCIVNPCPQNRPTLDSSTFEPHICTESSQCVGSKIEGYCIIFKHHEGYCCTGIEPVAHPGTCPSSITVSGDCSRHCLQDDMCVSDEKCCSNGCGLSCQPAEFANPSTVSIHIGECISVQNMGAFCSQRNKVEECSEDMECPTMYKCCHDGCAKRCLQPAVTTHCIHARLSAISIRYSNPSVFVPECDTKGEFQQIQSHYGLKWCVDSNGDEIPGTKSQKHPNCRYPRSCAVRACSKHCSFGYKTDNNGCIVCDCRDPCEMVDCAAGSSCYMVANKCTGDNCQPTPRCVPNICSSFTSLVDPFTEILAECDLVTSCPTGYHCAKSGFIGKGLCCKGQYPSQPSHIECPAVAHSNTSIDGAPCVVACRFPSDCQNSVCCYNGCGMSCQFLTAGGRPTTQKGPLQPIVAIAQRPRFKSIPPRPKSPQRAFIIKGAGSQIIRPVDVAPRPPVNNDITTLGAVEPSTISLPTKVGSCPALILNPGCKEECLTDADCIGFYKCCKASCAAKCVAPKVTTPCIHLLLSYAVESLSVDLPPPVQCTNGGHFRKHQCDIKEQQCWCVDDLTGKEQQGTRISAALALPDCSRPKPCFSSCADAESVCPYGIRLDSAGCPAKGMCVCQNPCQNFACKSPLTTCVLGKVECLSEYCPLISMCAPSLCGLYPFEVDVFNNPRTCTSDLDCKNGRCVLEEYENRQIGMCCEVKPVTQEPPRERRPTNCTYMRKAVEHLHNHGATFKTGKPSCADETGHFTSLQCDSSGTCWCVNPINGIEILGTRSRNAAGRNICSGASRLCPQKCNPTICPSGLQLDPYGCPIPGCHCSSPCDSVQCPKEQVCVLRRPQCTDDMCNPTPICESSVCSDASPPAVDSLTRRQLTCFVSSDCPVGYNCSEAKQEKEGLCCKVKEEPIVQEKIQPVLLSTSQPAQKPLIKEHKCPHGEPFTGTLDGTPLICKVSSNGCPSTHYCSTRAGERSGVCCVSKRYVCNLAMDRGPCSVSLPRFFYSSLNRTCSLFKYGGCAGNLNNFGTLDECQGFCEGIGIDFTFPYQDDSDAAKESYQLGFTLTGPQLQYKERHPAEISLLRLLTSSYEIPETAIDEIRIKEDNVVRFKISHPKAKEFAKTISQAVSSGKLGFSMDDATYRAEPQTLFAQQISNAPEDMEKARAVFWTVLMVAAALAALIVLIFLITCIALCRSRNKDAQSTGRSTPSNFISHSIVAHRVPRTAPRPNPRRELIFSREDLHIESSNVPIRAFRRPSFGESSNRTFQNERPDSVIYC